MLHEEASRFSEGPFPWLPLGHRSSCTRWATAYRAGFAQAIAWAIHSSFSIRGVSGVSGPWYCKSLDFHRHKGGSKPSASHSTRAWSKGEREQPHPLQCSAPLASLGALAPRSYPPPRFPPHPLGRKRSLSGASQLPLTLPLPVEVIRSRAGPLLVSRTARP